MTFGNSAALSLVLLAIAQPALAQGTLTRSDLRAQAEAYYQAGVSRLGNSGLSSDLSGADFRGIEDRSFARTGFSGRGFAELGATFTPSSPGINGMFSSVVLESCTSAEVFNSNIGPHSVERAYGLASGLIEFTISSPMNWSWSGGWTGNTYNTGSYHQVNALHTLVDLGQGSSIVSETRLSVNGVGDWLEYFSRGGVIQPGHYQLTWSHESIATGGNTPFGFFPTAAGGAPLVLCIPSTFSVWPVPTPGPLGLLTVAGLLIRRRR